MFQELNLEEWELGVLGLHNPPHVPLRPYFDLIQNIDEVVGDVVELGVWKGASLLTTGLLLKEQNSQKRVFGFDSFVGFPAGSSEDDFSNFESMYQDNRISTEHYERVKRNSSHLIAMGKSLDFRNVSTSNDFSATNMEEVIRKIAYLGLAGYVSVIQMNVEEITANDLPENISLALLDLDLFGGYSRALPLLWERLSLGGYIYLDEYYSLKFPGPRLAVDEFCLNNNISIKSMSSWMGFPRYIIQKPL